MPDSWKLLTSVLSLTASFVVDMETDVNTRVGFPFCLKCLSEVWVNLETMLPCQSAEDGLKGEKRKIEIINMYNEISKNSSGL